jgi:hypothetical protein
MTGVQKVILLALWPGVTLMLFLLDQDGFALIWGIFGFYISILLTSWLSEKSKGMPNNRKRHRLNLVNH